MAKFAGPLHMFVVEVVARAVGFLGGKGHWASLVLLLHPWREVVYKVSYLEPSLACWHSVTTELGVLGSEACGITTASEV